MAVCSVDPGDPCESVDGPPVCSVKAIVVESGDHPEAAAGSIHVTPLHAQRAERDIKWGYMSDERVCDELGLPLPGAWATMPVDECVQAITAASHAATPWPNNSQPRQLLTKLAGEVAHRLLQEGCDFAGGASEEDPGVSAGSSQSVAASYLESMD